MYYGDNKEKAIETYCNTCRAAADQYKNIAPVIRDFHKKVYNCRFDKAIEAATENVYVHKHCGGLYIDIDYYGNGYTFTIASIKQENLIDGKRLDSDLLIESAQKRRAELLQDAAKAEQAAANMETIQARLFELKKVYNAIVDDLPYTVRDIYNIKTLY